MRGRIDFSGPAVAAAGEKLQSLASPALELPSKAIFWGGRGDEGRSLLPPPRADTVAARPGRFAAGLLAAVRRQSRPQAASAAQRRPEQS